MTCRRFLLACAAVLLSCLPARAMACTVTPALTSTVGPYSPAAVRAGAVPALQNRAGLACPSGVLVLLGGNYLRGKFTSQNGLTLKRVGGTEAIPYALSADSGATVPIAQGATIDYMQNNLLNLLGLLGSSNANLPFFVKPASATVLPAGTYEDKITINWNWNLCTGLGALGACVGTLDKGTGTSVVTVDLVATPRDVTVTLSTTTSWDAINGTSNPKAIPGARGRVAAAVYNPDIVALDPDTLFVRVKPASGTFLALDGDGTGSGSVVSSSGSAGLSFSYVSPGSTTDDVDFSNDNGASWGYVPAAGDTVSEGAVTDVRLHLHGSMAAQSTYTISLPYLVR